MEEEEKVTFQSMQVSIPLYVIRHKSIFNRGLIESNYTQTYSWNDFSLEPNPCTETAIVLISICLSSIPSMSLFQSSMQSHLWIPSTQVCIYYKECQVYTYIHTQSHDHGIHINNRKNTSKLRAINTTLQDIHTACKHTYISYRKT